MAQIVKLRRSSVSGQKPTNSNLQLGELALNTTDGKVFLAVSGSGGPSVQELVSTNTVNTGSIYLTDNVTASFFTGSFIGDGSNLYNLPNVSGSINHLAFFNTNYSVSSSWFANIVNSGNTLTLGTTTYNVGEPERLVVDNNTSYNIASFQTTQNNTYAEVNIRNFGTGSNSSTDLVFWNDITTENANYFDIGLNSSNYNAGFVGYGSDAYIVNHANDLYIGTNTTGSNGHLHLFTADLWKSSSISIYNDGTIGVNTDKLNNNSQTIPSSTDGFAVEISGSVKFRNDINVLGTITGSYITGSFIGNASGLTNVPFHITGSDIDGNQYNKTFTKLHFDSDTGLNVSESAVGTAFISIGSHFKDIFVSGSPLLSATGSDAFEVIAEGGIGITTSITDTNSNGYVKELKISATTLSSSLNNRINTITGSLNSFTSSINTFTSSVVLTSQTGSMNVLSASYALTAAFALNAGGGLGGGASDGSYVELNQTTPSTTWTFNHKLGQKYPIFQVFDSTDRVIIPSQIIAVDSDNATITFPSAQTGRVIASLGTGPGGMSQYFSSAATWSLNHNMGTEYPIVTVYSSAKKIIYPQEIKSIDGNNVDVYFSTPVAGYLNVSKGGHIISGSIDMNNINLTGSNILSSSAQITNYGYAITGSNTFTGNQVINGTLTLNKAKMGSTCVTLTAGSNQTIFDLSGFDGANFDYVIKNGSNMRGGLIMSVWDNYNSSYNETSTTDLGNTSDVTFSVSNDGKLKTSIASGTWNIEVMYRALKCS